MGYVFFVITKLIFFILNIETYIQCLVNIIIDLLGVFFYSNATILYITRSFLKDTTAKFKSIENSDTTSSTVLGGWFLFYQVQFIPP